MPSYAIPMPSLSPLRCSKSWYDMIWVDDYDPRRQLNRRVCIQLAKPSFSQSWSHHSIVTKFPNLEKIRPWDATRNQPLMSSKSSRFSVAHLQHLAKSSGWFNSIHLTRLCMVKERHCKNCLAVPKIWVLQSSTKVSKHVCTLGTCIESIPAMLSHLGFHHSNSGLAVSDLSNEFQWYDITTKACETLRQGTTYVTVRVWPRWQFEPSLQLPQWSHCKAGPPESVSWQGHVAQDGPSDWIHHDHQWYHQ